MYAGIDAGSISFKIVILKDNGEYHRETIFHRGEPVRVFNGLLERFNLSDELNNMMINGRYGALLSNLHKIALVDPVRALVKNHSGGISRIIDIGASKLCMIELKKGAFQRLNTNSLCASGTGAFLDQQMKRMGIGYKMLKDIRFIENPPSIATRCAVFAKSDLIHRQQQGYSIEMLWNGLVKGMAESAFSTLFRGKSNCGDVMLIGGLTRNKIFIKYLERLLQTSKLSVSPDSCYYQAESNLKYRMLDRGFNKYADIYIIDKKTEAPLKIEKTRGHDHTWEIDCYGNEVDLFSMKKGTDGVYIGVDIGSTSTKLVAADAEGTILFGLYTRTGGKPLEAFKNLLRGIKRLDDEYSLKLRISGFGTTGSGRKLVGKFAGSDLIVNEITAHLKGAIKEYPDVRTIFEIGGQDSKYISAEDGWMKDANMNYVCAAGTGSFIEEQASNLQIKLNDIENICSGVSPPVSSDRCTVFMEQDATQLLINGFTKGEVMASMLYSVCKNYLNRVVQARPVIDPVLFLGATSKNRMLVRAFENILGRKVHTSLYGHITGAIGVTEMLRKNPPSRTKFRGLGISGADVDITETNCSLCNNRCRITIMNINSTGEKISWGYMCGKEPEAKSAKRINSLRYIAKLEGILFPESKKSRNDYRLYYPRALQFFSHFALWRKFFDTLDIDLLPSEPTGQRVASLAREYSISDFCYPLKISIGHIISLIADNRMPVFLPYNIQDTPNPVTKKSHFCPISQGFPSIVKNTLDYNSIHDYQLISPVIDLERNSQHNSDNLYRALHEHFAVSRKDCRKAFDLALEYHQSLNRTKFETALKINNDIRKKNRECIALLGRPYNILDKVLNLDLLKSIGQSGFEIIPGDLLPVRRCDLNPDLGDIYWSYGQHLAACAEFIKKEPGMFAIYLTNFSCGPDSFLLSTIEKIMGRKPFLILELDELGGNAGYITRLEAFYDRIENYTKNPEKNRSGESICLKMDIKNSINGHRVYIPPIHPFATKLISHAFRAFSVDAVPMLKEDMQTYLLGRSKVRGSECMPAASTIGTFMHYLNGNGSKPGLLFMPCTSGPCRFGQYARLHDSIIKSDNMKASIFSPSSEDDYRSIKGRLRVHLIRSVILSDLLTKLGCALRPYENNPGDVDSIIKRYINILSEALEQKKGLLKILKGLKNELCSLGIDRNNPKKPLIGIVGEIYVRNSPFSNSFLIRNIEKNGGEAWMTSSIEWLYYTSSLLYENNKSMGHYFKNRLIKMYLAYLENSIFSIFSDFIDHRTEPDIDDILQAGQEYIPLEFTGETILTVGRGVHFIKQKADMIVNVAPFSCMPGAISSAIFRNISRFYGVPIISMFYDGETDFNDLLSTYISNLNC